jgi:8-oxo-dGTP pyrophosphatase MutT (NUDIX family)
VVPVVEVGEPTLLFTRRTQDVRTHKGEVSFPGGARHPEDRTLLHTALRETEEEVGIPEDRLEVLGRLRYMRAAVSGFVVVPFVARLAERPTIRPNPAEVDEVLELELGRLAAAERLEERSWGRGSYHTYTYRLDGQVVWGLTGRILHHLLETLRQEGWTWQT